MNEDISKSQLKREALSLLQLGEKITLLPVKCINGLPLTPALREAILHAKKHSNNSAKKRELHLIGKLFRDLDEDVLQSIQQSYTDLIHASDLTSPRFRSIEKWRERLLAEDGQAMTEFLQQHQCDDIQQLRVLVRQAKLSQHTQKHPSAPKELFRLLREIIK